MSGLSRCSYVGRAPGSSLLQGAARCPGLAKKEPRWSVAPTARAHDPQPLDARRLPASRFAGTCRDFTVLLCAALRHQGVPARARCGFGAYFREGTFGDHWVCEHWSAEQRRWIRTDAQLDSFQQEALKLRFDPLDVPEDAFLVAGRAWRACAEGSMEPALRVPGSVTNVQTGQQESVGQA